MRDWYQIHLPYSFDADMHWSEKRNARKARIAELPAGLYKQKFKTEAAAKAALTRAGEDPGFWEICECGYL
jgi:hypothetical protein